MPGKQLGNRTTKVVPLFGEQNEDVPIQPKEKPFSNEPCNSKVVCIPHANSGCSDSNNMQFLDKRSQIIPNTSISAVMQNISRDSKMSSK